MFKLSVPFMRYLMYAALCASAIGGCVREKDRLDEEVRRLCAKDGGVKVYEEVKMPAAMFDQFGVVVVSDATEKRPLGSRYVLEEETKYYRKGKPSLRMERARIIRSADGKVLGEFASYHRVGGDLLGPWHDSTFVCPLGIGTASLKKSVFRIESMAKK